MQGHGNENLVRYLVYNECSVNVSYGDGASDGDNNLGIHRKMRNRAVLRCSDCQNHINEKDKRFKRRKVEQGEREQKVKRCLQ